MGKKEIVWVKRLESKAQQFYELNISAVDKEFDRRYFLPT
jgi:hypothetical protein